MNKIKVIFCGTPNIAANILLSLLEMTSVSIELVISQPDRIVGRKKQLTQTPVKKVALENNLKIEQPLKIAEIYEIIQKSNPDFIVTCAYGQFIPSKILQIPKIDAINIHGSLLPKYRGGAPIQYAIKNGDKKTGISIMKMVKEMDAGDYYVQEEIDIDVNDDAGSLFEKMTLLGQKMIKKYLLQIYNNQLQLIKQNPKKVTYCKNISSEEERIIWNNKGEVIRNHIRSLSPSPIAHTFINNERYKIKSIELTKVKSKYKEGSVVGIKNEGIQVATADVDIIITNIQRPGKKMINASLYKHNNLNDIKVGDFFE
ncbi:methionyl-tRNA formyltransferase [Mesoplasma corruscae]|uniref:Methionyl-tRNA formyltransferase n=1 Tax=Mesoplasma corruscae TaxID=216874 RepID=A0A2S5RG28_9MOLU|nr:methionyl-tRNA formyltransferase [Mesoplasma corruscae]PPE06248.1 methionyl-tRNA formyltransferase [Mesoplasma corruscae]